jgi:hypothetical protein
MRLFGRFRAPASDAELDRRLAGILDDRLTPGAPQSLYSYMREVPMTTPTETEAGGLRGVWRSIGLTGRTAVTMAAALAVVLVAAAVVVLPRTIGTGSGQSATPYPLPSYPPAPAGWHLVVGFGTDGGRSGGNLLQSGPRIAVHVVCDGPGDLVVMASTDADGITQFGRAVQAATFQCAADIHGGRVEFTAPSGRFQEVWAAVISSLDSTARTSFVVSVEIPDATPAPTVSATPAQ